MSYQIGIIGAGFLTQYALVKAIKDTAGFSLAAVLDPDQGALEAVARLSPETLRTTSADEFFAAGIDAVHVATPNNMHERYACRALSLGLATLIEKPLAGTVAAGRRILKTHRKTGSVAIIGYMSKHNSTNRKVKSLIDAGAIGCPCAMTATSLGWREGDWRNQRDKAGLGSLGDLGIYPVVTAVHLFGTDPTSCQATVWPSGKLKDTDIYAEGTLWFGGNCRLHLESSFTEPTPGGLSEYTVVGRDGLIRVRGSWAMDGGGYLEIWNHDGHKVIKPDPVNPYAEQYLILERYSRGDAVLRGLFS